MSKYVQLNLFNLDGSAASVFKIFPQEAHTGSLRDWIELAGGIVLEPDEEDPYTVTLIDVEWFSETAGSDEINIPSDCFLSSFIYECYEWERVFDLNQYRFGESKYVPYDANEILRRITSWSDLKFLPVREALPLVLESPEFLYETPQKRYRLEEDQNTETSIISSSRANESSEPIGSQDETLEPETTEDSEMDPSLNLSPVVSVSIGYDEELVLRRVQSEDDNTSDIEEVPVPSSTEKKRRKASDESSPSAKRKKKSPSSKSKKSSEDTPKKFQNNKCRKRKISTNAESIVHDVEDNSTEIHHPELTNGEEIEVLASTPAKSPVKKAERGGKNTSRQKLQKHVGTAARKETTEEREVKENRAEPPLKRTKDKNKRRKKEGEERQPIPEPAQLEADVDLSEINTSAHSPDQKPSETIESVQHMNSTNGLPQTKKRKRKKFASSSSVSTPSIPTDASTIELPSPSSSNSIEESSDSSDIQIIPYKDRNRSGKAIPCTLCSFCCLNQFELVNHMRLHTGEQKFSCPYCSFFTNDKSTLTKHKKDHKHGKKLRCLKCEFSTGNSSQLEAHCKTHDEIKTYQCNLCDYKSTTAYDLRVHGRIHQQNGKT